MTIRNVNIAPDAAIAGSKITLVGEALASGKIYVGDSNGESAEVALSGDATLSNTGALTIAATSVENSMLAGSITQAKLTANSLDGTIAKDVADDDVIGGIPLIYSVAIGAGAAADHDITVTHKVKVIDCWAVHEGGAGEASDTIQLKNGATAISDAMAWSGADNAVVRAGTLDDAQTTIAAAGTLRVTTTDNDAGTDVGAGTFYVMCHRIA